MDFSKNSENKISPSVVGEEKEKKIEGLKGKIGSTKGKTDHDLALLEIQGKLILQQNKLTFTND